MCGYSSVAPRGSCHRLMIDDAPMPVRGVNLSFRALKAGGDL
jgi:hypothetical protein